MTDEHPTGDDLLDVIRERLGEGRQVRRRIAGGRLHVDRQLPFLVVHRRPLDRPDAGTRRLVLSQASYLVAPADPEQEAATRAVVSAVAESLAPIFGAFLVVEVWTAALDEEAGRAPLIRVVTPDPQSDVPALDELVEALEALQVGYVRPEVRPGRAKSAAPPGLPPLMAAADANRLACYTVGIQLDPFFRTPEGTVYPELVRELTIQMSSALQRAFFVFSRSTAAGEPPSTWQGFGRRAMVRAVRHVDEALGELCSSFDFILGVTPVDTGEAWDKFKESGFSEPPTFRYRPLTTDAELLLRRLYDVPLEHVEDPTLERIFREKLREVARQLTMLAERNTHRFLHGSLQLYGGVEPDLLALAEALLSAVPAPAERSTDRVDALGFAAMADAAFAAYGAVNRDFDARCEIRDDVSGVLVSRGTLLIDRSLSLPSERADALLQHEVGTHVLTWFNGSGQPLRVFRDGLAGYEQLQEGLAVLAEYLAGGLTPTRLALLAARVVAVARMVDGASFVEIFRALHHDHGLAARTSFTATMRVTRGGGLTKDAVYLRGLLEVVEYVREGGDLDVLQVGKIARSHVPVARELLYRGVLQAASLRPAYLDRPGAKTRLEELRDGLPIVEMHTGAHR